MKTGYMIWNVYHQNFWGRQQQKFIDFNLASIYDNPDGEIMIDMSKAIADGSICEVKKVYYKQYSTDSGIEG